MSEARNDIELLKYCLNGQTESFSVLVGRYQSLVCAITYSATGSVDKSEELAQETFLLAWKNLHQLKNPAKFRAWLCRIAHSVIQNWLRDRQRDVVSRAAPLEAASSQSASITPPVEAAIDQEQQVVVNQALECIPEQYRVPLILFYRENKSAREVAAIIGLNENTTRQRIFRARGLLKDQVATMVETTLAQSKPGKVFTAGVLASVAGISIKGAATAGAASAVTTGISSLALKMTGIAAGVLIVGGLTFMVYHHKGSNPSSSPIEMPGFAANPNETESTGVTSVDNSVQPDANVAETPEAAFAPQRDTTDGSPNLQATTTPHEFKPKGILSGLITDAETGEPVRNATIYISNNRRAGEIQTDAHGFYSIDKIYEPGNCTIYIDSNDYVGFGLNSNAPTLNLSQDQQVVKHFQLLRACKVEVRVVDANGIPMEGVRVIPTSLADSRAYEINDHAHPRRTDFNGCVLLGGLPPLSTEYMITALATKIVRKRTLSNGTTLAETQFTHCPTRAVVRLTDPNNIAQVSIVLERGETVYGYAEYSDGRPATDIMMSVQPSWWHCMSSEDHYPVNPDGTFAISHVVPGTYNIRMTTTNSDGFPVSTRIVMQKDFPLAENEPLLVRLPISSPDASASISGRFYFQGKGVLDEVYVTAHSSKLGITEDVFFQVGPEDFQGKSFTINGLKPGNYQLIFSGLNVRRKVLEDITAPCMDMEVELEVVNSSRIEGFVIDELTQRPITHFQTRLKTLSGSNITPEGEWITFNQDEGHFSLKTLGPGIFQVQALADGYAPGWSDPVNTDENQDIIISLSQGGALTARVINQAGDPVNGAKVIPLSWAGDINPRMQHLFSSEKGAVLTKNGIFTLPHLPVGNEAIKITHPDYALQTIRDIEIQAGQVTQTDNVILTSGGTVEGFVLDELDNPLVNQTICFCDAMTGTTDNPSHRWATAVTDANGFYQVFHLPTQPCYVYRDRRGKVKGVVRRSVTPQEGETIRLDFGGDFKVRGMLELQNEALPQRWMVLRALSRSHFECFTMTDEFGHFIFSGIVPGTYHLDYEDSESKTGWQEVTSVTVSEADLDMGVVDEISLQDKPQASGMLPSIPVSSKPGMRRLSLKLPLLQPRFAWTFMSKSDYLAGKLILRIKQGEKITEIVIFEDGRISAGWQTIPLPENLKAGEIYFGFESIKPYLTAPNDNIELELHVVKDLDGIGALQTGFLPAGIYKAQGTYSMLTNEYQVPDEFKAMPEETIEKLKKATEFRAFLEDWDTKWPLQITGNEGWLDLAQREGLEQALQRLENQ